LHEIKHDGYRLIVRRDGKAVQLFTRRRYDWTDRYPAIAVAAAKLPARSFKLTARLLSQVPTALPCSMRSTVDAGRPTRCCTRSISWSSTARIFDRCPWASAKRSCRTSRAIDLGTVDRHPLASVATLVLGLRWKRHQCRGFSGCMPCRLWRRLLRPTCDPDEDGAVTDEARQAGRGLISIGGPTCLAVENSMNRSPVATIPLLLVLEAFPCFNYLW
jgi:hypothetical protein